MCARDTIRNVGSLDYHCVSRDRNRYCLIVDNREKVFCAAPKSITDLRADGRQTIFAAHRVIGAITLREKSAAEIFSDLRTLGRGSALAFNPVRIPTSQIKNDCQNKDHHHKGRYCLHRVLLIYRLSWLTTGRARAVPLTMCEHQLLTRSAAP